MAGLLSKSNQYPVQHFHCSMVCRLNLGPTGSRGNGCVSAANCWNEMTDNWRQLDALCCHSLEQQFPGFSLTMVPARTDSKSRTVVAVRLFSVDVHGFKQSSVDPFCNAYEVLQQGCRLHLDCTQKTILPIIQYISACVVLCNFFVKKKKSVRTAQIFRKGVQP